MDVDDGLWIQKVKSGVGCRRCGYADEMLVAAADC